MENYQKRRREILSEIICEYIEDEQYNARRIYEEILAVLANEVNTREDAADKASQLRELTMGYKSEDVFPKAFEV